MDGTNDSGRWPATGAAAAGAVDHEPLTAWVCDVCGELITDPARGLVVARHEPATNLSYGFRLVHVRMEPFSCSPSPHTGYDRAQPISDYVGPDGLARLLCFLSVWPLRSGAGGIGDVDEFVDLIRRLQTPWYEEARGRFADEDVQAHLRDTGGAYPYLPRLLRQIATGEL